MADNLYVNKVEYGNETLIDLTNDTVTENDVLLGKSFHDKSGKQKSGALELANVAYSGDYDDLLDRYTFTVSSETLVIGRSN